jgi:hypothetical protein
LSELLEGIDEISLLAQPFFQHRIGAGKSDIRAIRVVDISERVGCKTHGFGKPSAQLRQKPSTGTNVIGAKRDDTIRAWCRTLA